MHQTRAFARFSAWRTQPTTLKEGAAHLSTQAARAHRAQRTVFAACPNHNAKGPFSVVVRVPASVSRYPAAGDSVSNEPAVAQETLAWDGSAASTGIAAQDLLQHQPAQRAAATGHQAGGSASGLQDSPAQPRGGRLAMALRTHGAHVLLVGGVGGMGVVSLLNMGLHPDAVYLSWNMLKTMVCNVPVAGFCAAGGDIVAQVMTGSKLRHLDLRRTVAAGVIGGSLQGFGTTMWVAQLNSVIPRSMIGFESASQLAWTLNKVLVDSAFWGTCLNTANIFLRRLAAGDSLKQAHANWKDMILDVTRGEFKFWPAFGAMVYVLVQPGNQVNAFGVGGFIWSVYLSFMANYNVASDNRGPFRYGRPSGVRIKPLKDKALAASHLQSPRTSLDSINFSRLVPTRFGDTASAAQHKAFDANLAVLRKHKMHKGRVGGGGGGAVGLPRPTRVMPHPAQASTGRKLRV